MSFFPARLDDGDLVGYLCKTIGNLVFCNSLRQFELFCRSSTVLCMTIYRRGASRGTPDTLTLLLKLMEKILFVAKVLLGVNS